MMSGCEYMSYFYVFNFRRWRRFGVITFLILLLALFLWLQRGLLFPFLFPNEPVAFTKGSDQQPYIALTFNISWGDEKVHDILAELERENVQATFFVSGEWAERHPQIVDKIHEGNHELGMLGYRYKSYLKQDIDAVRRDLFQAKHVFDKLGYPDIKWLRPPSGHFDDEIESLATRLGLTVIDWTINPDDWKNPGTDQIVEKVTKKLTKGDIILLHASDAAKQTAGALKEIIPYIQDKKLEFVTISQLVSQVETDIKMID